MIKKMSLVALLLIMSRLAAADPAHQIKIALITPEGSTWTNVLHDFDKALQEKSGGALGLKIYAGGVSGDEKDVLRKMRIGQLQAAGMTGMGLGMITPSVRVLELPLLFQNYAEVDAVTAAIRADLEKEFAAKGFVLLGWSEAGFTHLMTQKPVTKREELQGMKLWLWEGDPLAQEMFAQMGIVPVPLSLTDVLTSLQTGIVEGVYNTPLGAIALQWNTKTKYLTGDPIAYAAGGIVITKKAFDALPAGEQQILKATAEEKLKQLTDLTRKDNTEAMEALKQTGMKMVSLTPEAKIELAELSKKVHTNLADKLYPKALLDKVCGIIAAVRK